MRLLGCIFFLSSCSTSATSKMGGGSELLRDRRTGISKANSRSRWVCLRGCVLDFCDKRSCETVSEMFDFCHNISWDVAAELLLWEFKIRVRSSNGFGGLVVKGFCSTCLELQRMLFLECWSIFVLVFSPTMF